MPTYRFQEVTTSRYRYGKCPVCGKRVTRSKTFMNTINPFNRNADGSVRTAAEVRANVEAQADAWVPDFTHATCEQVSA